MRQGVPGGADHAEDVDVEDPPPLLVGVVGDGADGADPRVGHDGVQRAELLGRPVHRRPYRRVVGDVGGEGEGSCGRPLGLPVQHGDPRAALQQQRRDGRADARGTAGDQRAEPLEVPCPGHAVASWIVRRAAQTGPSG